MMNAAEVRTGSKIGPRHPGIPRVPGVPVAPTVLSMLQSARRGLAEATDETSPGARYVTAHLAALRAAAPDEEAENDLVDVTPARPAITKRDMDDEIPF